MNTATLNRELTAEVQDYGRNPLSVRNTGHYRNEYIQSFAEKWDQLIDWEARAKGEGRFFAELLHEHKVSTVLDAATGTGFHSVGLIQDGFAVTSVDGSAAMLVRAFENARSRGIILKTAQSDWRWLTRDVPAGGFDAVVCLGNSFTHLFSEDDRRRALAEFYSVLAPDGVLVIDHRNYDAILDHGYSSKHQYYYCGEQVEVGPEYVDSGLARFRYAFPDGSEYRLNMFPLRQDYVRGLIQDAGFQSIQTYGDFEEGTVEGRPDFFVHVASKAHRAGGKA